MTKNILDPKNDPVKIYEEHDDAALAALRNVLATELETGPDCGPVSSFLWEWMTAIDKEAARRAATSL